MRRLSMFSTAVLLSFVLMWQPACADGQADAKRVEMAKVFVNQLATGEFEKAVERFDKVMTKTLSADKLKQIWGGVVAQYGTLQRVTETRTEIVKQYHMVFVTGEFQRGKLDTKVVFTSNNEIAGLFFLPTGQYQPPRYADHSAFAESEIDVGKERWALPGTLSLPKGEGPFPAVVLVHGSGPNDRDETVGPNKPFRDLAHGLASRRIAVLRYEKRTKQHGLETASLSRSMTVKEETVDDAVAAVEFLRSHKDIDARRVFVLGHSLGGYLIPRIAAANSHIAGFVSLAGFTRPFEDLMLEQTKYILSLDGEITQEEKGEIEELEQQVARVKSPELSAETATKLLPLGVPVNYWLDLRGYDPAVAAKELKKPMLVLQGERDYQVTMDDFAKWKTALGPRDDVKFISYPKLNHLFVEGEGKSSPAEYSAPGNVAQVVINDIATWINP